MSSVKRNIIYLLLGVLLGVALTFLLIKQPETNKANSAGQDKSPLYWVAPMDDTYRRDKPGKSPMGMDLVPVYPQSEQALAKGEVKISPQVINQLSVKTVAVEQRDLSQSIKTTGYIQFDEDKIHHVHPRVQGWVEQLFVTAVGDPVEKGQPLYELYSPELVNAQEELLIALKRNNSELIRAAKSRLKALHLPEDFITNLQKNKQIKKNVTFYAPRTGVLKKLNIRHGFYIKPGMTLMSIAGLEKMWVEAQIFERDAALVKADLPVKLTLDYYPGRTWHSQLERVYPVLNEKTRTVRVRFSLNNPNLLLKPNMFANIEIETKPIKNALVVPAQAVIQTGDQNKVVLALGDGIFKSVDVVMGQAAQGYIEIIHGLTLSDKVVSSAQFLIDSESSKTSDFMRMQSSSALPFAQVKGVINSINKATRALNISREPIAKWNRSAATMDFIASPRINLERLMVNSPIEFSFEVGDELVVTQVTLLEGQ